MRTVVWFGAFRTLSFNSKVSVKWGQLQLLALYHRRTGRGLNPSRYAWNLVSGLCLMLALRCALQGADWWWGAGYLAASGAAHMTYLRQRWATAR